MTEGLAFEPEDEPGRVAGDSTRTATWSTPAAQAVLEASAGAGEET